MDVTKKLRGLVSGLFSGSKDSGYNTEASVDLDILDAHDQTSKLLVGVDLSRLERRNKERRYASHQVLGDLHVDAGELQWNPHRMERACGVQHIAFKRDQLRSIERKPGAILAVLKDGTNVPFIVSTQAVQPSRRGLPHTRASRQEPPLIS